LYDVGSVEKYEKLDNGVGEKNFSFLNVISKPLSTKSQTQRVESWNNAEIVNRF